MYIMLYIFIKKKEVWKYITYPSVKPKTYLISNHGRVFSSYYRKIIMPAKKTVLHSDGTPRTYLQVVLKKANIIDKERPYIDVNIHRLVAWEFVPNLNPKEYNFVHHLNNDSLENYYENLQWTNNQLNQIEARNDGFLNPRKGDSHPYSIYGSVLINEICELIYDTKLNNEEIIKIVMKKYESRQFTKTNLTSLLSHLRRGDRHKDIVKKYTE